jgi:large subunit ribosomal protein L20
MVKVKHSVASRARHKKIRKATKGYRGKNHTTFKLGMQAYMKAGMHAYKGRKLKKRDFRRLWISRISGALRAQGLKYSVMKNQWLHAQVEVDRKNLSELAIHYPEVFNNIIAVGQKAKKITVSV